MNKALALAVLLGLGVAVSGCASYVKTYDAEKNLLGTCMTGGSLFGLPLFPRGAGHCDGSANPKAQK